jgi:hypothetical protein
MSTEDHHASAALRSNLRESFGRVVYSHKTQEKAREIEARRSVIVKWINIVLITATSGTLLSTVITNERALLYTSAGISAAALAFTVFQFSFNPEGAAARHRDTARELWFVRERYLNLLTDMEGGLGLVETAGERDKLTSELRHIYGHAPDTSSRAYKSAQRALKVEEEMTFSEEELDDLLPQALRIGRRATGPPPY